MYKERKWRLSLCTKKESDVSLIISHWLHFEIWLSWNYEVNRNILLKLPVAPYDFTRQYQTRLFDFSNSNHLLFVSSVGNASWRGWEIKVEILSLPRKYFAGIEKWNYCLPQRPPRRPTHSQVPLKTSLQSQARRLLCSILGQLRLPPVFPSHWGPDHVYTHPRKETAPGWKKNIKLLWKDKSFFNGVSFQTSQNQCSFTWMACITPENTRISISCFFSL